LIAASADGQANARKIMLTSITSDFLIRHISMIRKFPGWLSAETNADKKCIQARP
jgi:hypothetical protein